MRLARARIDLRYRLIERLVSRASRARDAGRFDIAAALYEEVLAIAPGRTALRIQCAHVLKEAGDLAGAEFHYVEAASRWPAHADARKQLAAFYRWVGRDDPALATVRGASLAAFSGWFFKAAKPDAPRAGSLQEQPGMLVPELLPTTDAPRSPRPSATITRLGTRRIAGMSGQRVVRGVEAIRGHCLSRRVIDSVELRLAGVLLRRERVRNAVVPCATGGVVNYAFNIWHDFSAALPGRHRIEIRLLSGGATVRTIRDSVVVCAPPTSAEYPNSDAMVIVDEGTAATLEQRINALPSEVRPARRSLLGRDPERILVQRVDQLGDLVVSVPAIRRLRALFPQARIVGLVSAANADFARTIEMFDEVVVAAFAEDPRTGRRVMAPTDQQALRDRLAPFNFDVAIDLSESSASRPLLRLSGASLLFGFDDHLFPWLTGGSAGHVRDPVNGQEMTPPSARALALVERIGASLREAAEYLPRPELPRELIRRHGIDPSDSYIVLHVGARLAYSRWPHFAALAALLLERTRCKIVVLSEESVDAGAWGGAVPADRLRFIEGRVEFDQLDALLVHAALVVANDSGLKHLAALRGTPVVSLHMARLNWNEWGQQLSGSIISRRVPCAGCAIALDPAECGKDFACLYLISPEEVARAVLDLLP